VSNTFTSSTPYSCFSWSAANLQKDKWKKSKNYWKQCSGSVTFWDGSRFGFESLGSVRWTTDPDLNTNLDLDPNSLLFSSVAFKTSVFKDTVPVP
jgi:hypothetical protein